MGKEQMTVGVFFGSRNPEHEVSIITAQLIMSELRKLGCNVIPVYVDKKGVIYSDDELGYLKFFTAQGFEARLEKKDSWFVQLDAPRSKLILRTKGVLAKERIINLVFPAFHGMNGEDGTFQGLFELCNIPYVGCGVAASAITMDKILTKQLYVSENIPTVPFIYFQVSDWEKDQEETLSRADKLTWPLFVKPARLGSSIGITKARNKEELVNACEVALHYDSRVIVEESVEDLMDVTCAVLGNSDPQVSLVQESVFQGEHFSYESKYIEDGGAQLGNDQKNIIIPARLSEERTKELQNLSVKIYKLFDCTGTARVDFLYDKKNDKLYANEINTMPGTLYHHLWKASGIEIGQLIERLIDLAIEKHREKNDLTFTFNSTILRHANSIKLQMKRD